MFGRSVRAGIIAACFGAVLAAVVAAVIGPSVASAHTEFDSSDPADGSTVTGALDVITVRFTAEAEIVGDGFRLLDADAAAVPVAVTSSDDSTVITMRPRRPLPDGRYGVAWNVAGSDGHPLAGTFEFRLRVGSTSPDTAAAPNTGAGTTAAKAVPATTAITPTTATTTGTGDGGDGDELDSVLASAGDRHGPGWAAIGRSLLLVGLMIAAGAAALANGVLVDATDRVTVFGWARWAALPVVLGTVVDVLGQAGAIGGVSESLGDVLSDWLGVAVALRLAGAVALVLAARLPISRSGRPPTALLVGVGALVLSFSFDGHTVSRGFPPLHAAVNIVHVAAASVWAGTVIVLAAVLVHRRRAGQRSDVLMLSLRFSGIATVALGVLVVAGVLLSIIVVDSLDDLFDTEWGLTLLLKFAAVAVAVAFGTHNRLTLLPALQRDPANVARRTAVRNTLVAESLALVLVLVATAWLVAAATT